MKHGKHYVDAAKLIDSTKAYDVNEALELACKIHEEIDKRPRMRLCILDYRFRRRGIQSDNYLSFCPTIVLIVQ